MVKMITLAAGPKGVVLPGKTANIFTAEEEKDLIAGGYAEKVKEKKQPKPEVKKVAEPETATIAAPETATAPPARRRKKAAE
jgi:hypothetical protein